MKTVIVYYSMSKNTEFAARELAREAGADVVEIVPVKAYPDKGLRKFFWGGKDAVMKEEPELEPYDVNFDEYECVVIATPVWAATFAPPVRSFVKENLDALKSHRLAALVCSGGAGGEKVVSKLAEEIGVDSFDFALTLVDPKDRPSSDKINAIQEFAENFK